MISRTVAEMARYRVTVLRHMNIELTVEAESENAAFVRAEGYVASASQDTWGREIPQGETWSDIADVVSVEAGLEGIEVRTV